MTKYDCGERLEYLDYSLRNTADPSLPMIGLRNDTILHNIYNVVYKGMTVGESRICGIGLDSIKFLTNELPVGQVEEYSTRFMGILVRVSNYQ